MKAKRVKSKEGLIAYETRRDPDGIELKETEPETFRMLAPDPVEIVKGILTAYRDDAHDLISEAGRDPNEWPTILREKDVVDPVYCAARMFRDLHKLNRAMERLAKHEAARRVAHEAIRAALAAGLTAHSLEVVLTERAILRDVATQAGRKKGGAAPKRRQWAEELANYLRRQGFNKSLARAALEDRDGVEIDGSDFDYRFYIEGNTIFCDDRNTQNEIGRMACSTFFDKGRYFRR